jgi:hypothetical protein
VDEGRKRVPLIAASLLAARKLSRLQDTRASPAQTITIHDAVTLAERIMDKIDDVFPEKEATASKREHYVAARAGHLIEFAAR